MMRYDLRVIHPDPDVGDVLVSVLTKEEDENWSKRRPEEELRLFRCHARFPVPDDDNHSGEWRVATVTFDIDSEPGTLAGQLTIFDQTTYFNFDREIAA